MFSDRLCERVRRMVVSAVFSIKLLSTFRSSEAHTEAVGTIRLLSEPLGWYNAKVLRVESGASYGGEEGNSS